MTSELAMIYDRLDEINKAMTLQGSAVEVQGKQLAAERCIELARPLQTAMAAMKDILDGKEQAA